MIDFLLFVFYFAGISFTVLLCAVNYLARIHYSTVFSEANDFGRKTERIVGKKVAVLSIVPIYCFLLSVLLYVSFLVTGFAVFLGFFVGLIAMNAIADSITVSAKTACLRCDLYEETRPLFQKCHNCSKREKSANWDTFEPIKKIINKLKGKTK